MPEDNKKPDPFDPEAFKLSTDYGEDIGAKKRLLRISVKRPGRQEFIRVHPTLEIDVWTLKVQEEAGGSRDEIYLVTPDMVPILGDDCVPSRMHLTINRQNDAFLWNCRLPDKDRPLAWHTTALAAVEIAKEQWIKVKANLGTGSYEVSVISETAKAPEPSWPDYSLSELLKLAFEGMVIDSPDHQVVQQLSGRA